MTELFRVGQENGHFGRRALGHNVHKFRCAFADVIRQNADPQIIECRLEDAKVIVDRQQRPRIVRNQSLTRMDPAATWVELVLWQIRRWRAMSSMEQGVPASSR